jgi:hypothetical protein
LLVSGQAQRPAGGVILLAGLGGAASPVVKQIQRPKRADAATAASIGSTRTTIAPKQTSTTSSFKRYPSRWSGQNFSMTQNKIAPRTM